MHEHCTLCGSPISRSEAVYHDSLCSSCFTKVSDFEQLAIPLADHTTNNGGSTDYYKLPSSAIDLQDLIEYKQMSFSLGNIFKACYRFNDDSHSSQLREINKVIWFAERIRNTLLKASHDRTS